ncbi:PREDICTED: uncharacterized protein LOC105362023 [Ceratosolen solmsi marchali]|uniref:Uncharacterized protein LOC105362023 n=1 Tax=Ceratosolen solmsi marchali TaxID=326594 RepID=A0AAJ7DV86_9HYME|nr:PREDICTED: uncharacterized protein LOC105362023 [Ceratosolen solmsi marchali]
MQNRVIHDYSNVMISPNSLLFSTFVNYENENQGSTLGQLFSWPIHLLSSIYFWLTFELRQILEEKINVPSSSDDSSKFLSSVASFVLGLILVKNYGDSFDNMISMCLGSWGSVTRDFFNLITSLSFDNIERVAIICVVIIFWIGAFRIVSNVIKKFTEAKKTCSFEHTQ